MALSTQCGWLSIPACDQFSLFFKASFLIQHRVWNWYSQLWSKTLTKTKVGIHQETHASPFRHLLVFSLASQLETGKLDSSLASGCFCIIIKVDLVFVSRWKISKNSHSVHLLLLHTGMHQSSRHRFKKRCILHFAAYPIIFESAKQI